MAKAKTKPASQPLPAPVEMELDVLRMDFGLQLRAEIDEFHVDRLADAYAANEPVPPIRVMHDSKTAWVWDGNHRMIGRRRAGFQTISCIVEHGTYRDAILRAAGANHEHGLPRSNRDKRAAVAKLLADKVWAKRSDRWIAETCRVSRPLVADVREDMIKTKNALESEAYEVAQVAELPPAEEGRVGRDGKTYPASKDQNRVADDKPIAPQLPNVERTALFYRLQDLYRDHLRGMVKLNRPQVELLQGILDGNLALEGQIEDQAVDTLEMHRGAATIAPYLTAVEPTDESPVTDAQPVAQAAPVDNPFGVVYGESGRVAAAEFRRRLVAWCQTQMRNIDDLDWQVIADVFWDVGSECKTWEATP